MKITKQKLRQIIKEELENLDEEEPVQEIALDDEGAEAKRKTLSQLQSAINSYYNGLTYAMEKAAEGKEDPVLRRSPYTKSLVNFEIPAGMKLDREEVAEALVQTAEAILDGARREKRLSPIVARDPRFTAGT